MAILCLIDLIQALFDPVAFSEGIEEADTFIEASSESDATLEHVLIFFSCCDNLPPAGLPEKPMLKFNKDNLYPAASTCLIQLVLPTRHRDYDTFKSHLTTGFRDHGGFGLR